MAMNLMVNYEPMDYLSDDEYYATMQEIRDADTAYECEHYSDMMDAAISFDDVPMYAVIVWYSGTVEQHNFTSLAEAEWFEFQVISEGGETSGVLY